jgi:sortase (surface protein transpeptidase)
MTIFVREHATSEDAGVVTPRAGVVDGAGDERSKYASDHGRQGQPLLHDAARGEAFSSAARGALLMIAAIAVGIVLNVAFVSRLEQSATQFKELGQLRYELAAGTGPISGAQGRQRPLAPGTPMALLTIPSLGLKEVVDEGTNSEVLLAGPGHLPSTVFPGGLGTSVIYGRAGTYGGPFAGISQLRKGARILVTIQDSPNTAVFRVTDIRSNGKEIPPIGAGGARLTLVTAKESDFVPSGVVYVDADIVGSALPTHAPVVKAQDLPANELPLGVDTGDLWILALWLIVLALVAAGAMWTWHRKGHVQAWIIFIGPMALVGYLIADQVSILLPNLT